MRIQHAMNQEKETNKQFNWVLFNWFNSQIFVVDFNIENDSIFLLQYLRKLLSLVVSHDLSKQG